MTNSEKNVAIRIPDPTAYHVPMTREQWQAVDGFFSQHVAGDDAVLTEALRTSDEAGLPQIQVSETQGKWLHLMARAIRAERILELGTLGGYSAIWFARALPADGRLVTLEIDPKHAAVAASNLQRAGLADRVEIHVGAALDTLATLRDAGVASFDLAFIDADKPNCAPYVESIVPMMREGGVIIVDNVVRNGAVADEANDEASVRGVRRCIEFMGQHPRLDTTAIQTVGSKGYDGFAFAIVNNAT